MQAAGRTRILAKLFEQRGSWRWSMGQTGSSGARSFPIVCRRPTPGASWRSDAQPEGSGEVSRGFAPGLPGMFRGSQPLGGSGGSDASIDLSADYAAHLSLRQYSVGRLRPSPTTLGRQPRQRRRWNSAPTRTRGVGRHVRPHSPMTLSPEVCWSASVS